MNDASINGWKPPVIYDLAEDKTRIATQEDIDRFVAIEGAYIELRNAVNKAVDVQENLVRRLEAKFPPTHAMRGK